MVMYNYILVDFSMIMREGSAWLNFGSSIWHFDRGITLFGFGAYKKWK